MSSTYVDTGVLVKLYSVEANSGQAISLVSNYAPPLPLTIWQELELRTALRGRVFRKEITAADLLKSLVDFDSDITSGRWQRTAIDTGDVHRQAEKLSALYAASIGCRTLDTLHVAAALLGHADELITFDKRQGRLAQRAGLRVAPPI
jgi:hypothetical protein